MEKFSIQIFRDWAKGGASQKAGKQIVELNAFLQGGETKDEFFTLKPQDAM